MPRACSNSQSRSGRSQCRSSRFTLQFGDRRIRAAAGQTDARTARRHLAVAPRRQNGQDRLDALRIDRAFGEGRKRWVVDFKASSVEGSGIERFLDQQAARYAPQLARYAAVVGDAGAPARTALYFPQLGCLKR